MFNAVPGVHSALNNIGGMNEGKEETSKKKRRKLKVLKEFKMFSLKLFKRIFSQLSPACKITIELY